MKDFLDWVPWGNQEKSSETTDSNQGSRCLPYTLTRQCCDTASVFYPELSIDHILLLPRASFLPPEGKPSYHECCGSLQMASEVFFNNPSAQVLYVSSLEGHQLRDTDVDEGYPRHLYSAVRGFLQERQGYSHVWLRDACLPPGMLSSELGGVHMGALLCTHGSLSVPPLCKKQHWFYQNEEGFSDLQLFSTNPWRALEACLLTMTGASQHFYLECGGEGYYTDTTDQDQTIEEGVLEILTVMGLEGSGRAVEANWKGLLDTQFLLTKACTEVSGFIQAGGALKQAVCTLSISEQQAREFCELWEMIQVGLTPIPAHEQLGLVRMLSFAVAVARCDAARALPAAGLAGVLEEAAVPVKHGYGEWRNRRGGVHLDFWMKDLSPGDLEAILAKCTVQNNSDRAHHRPVVKLTVGSSHTGGAGIGRFMGQHPELREVEVEWEGMRDIRSLCLAGAEHKSLQSLTLTHNGLGRAGAECLGEMLMTNSSITFLDIRENDIGAAGMRLLCRGLQRNASLRTLHAEDNSVGNDGVIAVTEAIMRGAGLKVLFLDGNAISDLGAKVMTVAVQQCRLLQLVSLRRNLLGNAMKAALLAAWAGREEQWIRCDNGGGVFSDVDSDDSSENGVIVSPMKKRERETRDYLLL
ncbi:unnamed protein product [Chrysoparadoxa australica]